MKKLPKSKKGYEKLAKYFFSIEYSHSRVLKTHLIIIIHMAKGKSTFQIGKSQSGLSWYVYPVNKKNLPQGEKLKLMKYDKKLRKHVEFTFKDVK